MSRKIIFSMMIFYYFLCFTAFADMRSILIFLDDSESHIGAITSDLIVALSQKPGPMLVSNSLLKNIFSEYRGDFNGKDNELLTKRYLMAGAQESSPYSDSDSIIKAKNDIKYILAKALNFDNQEWLVKSVGTSLHLLIPIPYLSSLGLSIKDTDKSTIDLKLGLKINHLQTVNNLTKVSQNFEFKEKYADYFLDELLKNSIFLSKSDYAQNKLTAPAWSIFIQGHGKYQDSIVGIRLHRFPEVLDYLGQKINCRLLIYSSCYAAGSNSSIIYKELNSAVQKQFSFPIITQAITDAPTLATPPKVELIDNHGLQLAKNHLNFADFVKQLSIDESIDYPKAISYLSASSKLSGADWTNLPQIRIPGTSWFSVLASPKEVISIGTILSRTRSATYPLNIIKFFKTNPRAILLYAELLPFELILDSDKIDSIISMIPGDAVHILSRISSKQKNAHEIINLFMKIEAISSRKVFYIKEINNLKDVVIYSEKLSGNKFSTTEKTENYACYYDQNKIFVQQPFRLGEEPNHTDHRVKKCLSIINQINGKVVTIEPIDLSKKTVYNYNRFIPNIDTNTLIKEILAPGLSFFEIHAGFEDKIKHGNILWINELKVQTNERYLSLPGVSVEQVITLKDLIFDKRDKFSYFFSYDGNFYHEKTVLNADYKDRFSQDMNKSSFGQEAGVQLPLSINSELIEKLKNTLEKRTVPPYKKLVQEASIRKEMSNFELDDAVKKLCEHDKKLGKEFVWAITKIQPNIDEILELIQRMKKRNLLNHILPLRYNKPLYLALQNNADYQIIKSLIDNGADASQSPLLEPLFYAFQGNASLKIIELLFASGVKLHEDSQALYYVIQSKSPDAHKTLSLLLEKGANPNAYNPSRSLPVLHAAILNGKFDMVETLINHGANVNIKDKFGISALRKMNYSGSF